MHSSPDTWYSRQCLPIASFYLHTASTAGPNTSDGVTYTQHNCVPILTVMWSGKAPVKALVGLVAGVSHLQDGTFWDFTWWERQKGCTDLLLDEFKSQLWAWGSRHNHSPKYCLLILAHGTSNKCQILKGVCRCLSEGARLIDYHVRFLGNKQTIASLNWWLMTLLIQDPSSFYHWPAFIRPSRSHTLVVNSTHAKGLTSDIHRDKTR